jgi:hypothetical protein
MAGFPKGVVALFFCVVAVAACSAPPPNDVASGVGFQDYEDWQARRAVLRGEAVVAPAPPPATVRPPLAPVTAALPPLDQAERSVAVQAQVVPVTAPTPVAIAPPPAPAAAPAQVEVVQIAATAIATAEAQAATAAATARAGSSRISDEQDFSAVAGRETIESDAERLARMQAARVVIAPTPLPDRPAASGPNIIDYALATSHMVGERRHTRRPISQTRHQSACAGFRAPDLAQEWFLENGGPARDRQGLDPDGDGFACDWNPAPYRAAAAAARE